MKVQELLQFPRLISELRRTAGVRQKNLALQIGVDQSYLCGVERGRRGTPRPEVLDRMLQALVVPGGDQADQVRWAAAHDRVVLDLVTCGLEAAAPLVSAALVSSRRLSAAEQAGLLSHIHTAIRSRDHLDRLASAGAAGAAKEVSM